MFSCEIYKIFKNTLFYRTPPAAAFKIWKFEFGLSPSKKFILFT